MFNKLALESLVQRGRSALYNDLVVLFQESQDLLYDDPRASDVNIVKILEKQGWTKRVENTLKHYTKMPIVGVRIYKYPCINLMCVRAPNQNLNMMRKQAKIKTGGMMMEDIHRLYDDRSGRMKESLDPSTSPFQFAVLLFTGLWIPRESNGDFTFTPEEIAALLLHEIGHIDNQIRVGMRIQQDLVDASDIVDYIGRNQDKQVVLELIKSVKKSLYIDKSWRPVIKQVEEYFNTSNSLDDPFYWEALSTLICVMSAELASNNLREYLFLESDGFSKLRTYLFEVDNERSADEFASRHGAYAGIVSFLIKAEALEGPRFKEFYRQINGVNASFILSLLNQFKFTFGLRSEEMTEGYDPLIRRLELIIETAKHAFHDENLPPEIAADINTQIKNAEMYLNEYKTADYRKKRVLIKTWKDNISKFGRLIKAPVQNRLSQDYGRLQDANRSLSRHPLYHLAKQ